MQKFYDKMSCKIHPEMFYVVFVIFWFSIGNWTVQFFIKLKARKPKVKEHVIDNLKHFKHPRCEGLKGFWTILLFFVYGQSRKYITKCPNEPDSFLDQTTAFSLQTATEQTHRQQPSPESLGGKLYMYVTWNNGWCKSHFFKDKEWMEQVQTPLPCKKVTSMYIKRLLAASDFFLLRNSVFLWHLSAQDPAF